MSVCVQIKQWDTVCQAVSFRVVDRGIFELWTEPGQLLPPASRPLCFRQWHFSVFQFCPSLYIRTPLSVLLHLYHGYSYCKLFQAFEQISNQMFCFLLLASMYITSAIYHWNNRFDLWLCPTGETRHRSLPTLFKEKRQINLHCKLKRSTVSQKKK